MTAGKQWPAGVTRSRQAECLEGLRAGRIELLFVTHLIDEFSFREGASYSRDADRMSSYRSLTTTHETLCRYALQALREGFTEIASRLLECAEELRSLRERVDLW